MHTIKSQDMNDIENCLRDAGLFEENMDPKVMLEYYNAIKNSENTASVEDEIRKNNAHTDECETDSKHGEPMESEEKNNDELLESASTEEIVNFCDMPVSSEKMLEVIHHEPKYHLAINFNSETYKKLNLRQKVSILYKYHTDLNKKIAAHAKRSIYPTPRAKDIVASNKFTGTLLRNSFDINDNLDRSEVIYTSRSGRQMKRKKYYEDDFDDEFRDDILESKKLKEIDDNEWRMKRTRSTDKKNTNQSNNNNNNNNNNNTETPQSTLRMENSENTKPSMDTPKETKRDYSTPLSKRNSLKKLSNEEIMKRSSLFSPTVMKKTRAETMFDKLREEEQKKNLQEREIELFKESLDSVESEDMLENIDSQAQVSTNSNLQKRSPVCRRAIGSRKRANLGDSDSNEPEPGKKALKNTPKTSASNSVSKSLSFRKEASSSGERTNVKHIDMIKIACPLCNEEFPEEDIQEHAATCCDPSENSQLVLRSSAKI